LIDGPIMPAPQSLHPTLGGPPSGNLALAGEYLPGWKFGGIGNILQKKGKRGRILLLLFFKRGDNNVTHPVRIDLENGRASKNKLSRNRSRVLFDWESLVDLPGQSFPVLGLRQVLGQPMWSMELLFRWSVRGFTGLPPAVSQKACQEICKDANIVGGGLLKNSAGKTLSDLVRITSILGLVRFWVQSSLFPEVESLIDGWTGLSPKSKELTRSWHGTNKKKFQDSNPFPRPFSNLSGLECSQALKPLKFCDLSPILNPNDPSCLCSHFKFFLEIQCGKTLKEEGKTIWGPPVVTGPQGGNILEKTLSHIMGSRFFFLSTKGIFIQLMGVPIGEMGKYPQVAK